MRHILYPLSAVALSASLLTGCALDGSGNSTGRSVGWGAAMGALAGAVVGQVAGGDSDATLKGAAIGAAIGAGGGYAWSTQMEKQRQTMEAATRGTSVQVSQTSDNRLKINVPADASFATNSAVINASIAPVLNSLAQTLVQYPNTTVSIIGHTDNTGTDAINNPLSRNRADSARSYLVARGVAGQRISTAGMGAREPVASNGSAAGRAQNRRIEIYVAENR